VTRGFPVTADTKQKARLRRAAPFVPGINFVRWNAR